MGNWIITVRLKEGARLAWARKNDTFALVPIEGEHGAVRGAMAWNTEKEAAEHMRKQLALAPELEDLGEIRVEQAWEPS